MPEWQQLVRERLGALGIGAEREEEVIAELAGHLNEVRAAALRRGLSEAEALARALEEVPDWCALNREISNAKEGPMNERAKVLWVPGMTMLISAAVFQLLLLKLIPPVSWVQPNAPLLFGGFWLLIYFAFGALGAWWSRRAGGSSSVRLLAGILPAAVHLAIFITVVLAANLQHATWASEYLRFSFQLKVFFSFVVLPGIALALGTLPFLRTHSQKSSAVSA